MSCVGRVPPTKRVTADIAVKNSGGTVWNVVVEPTGSAGTVLVYDGTSGAGTLMFSHVTPASGAAPYTISLGEAGLTCKTGIYVVLTNCVVIVHYT